MCSRIFLCGGLGKWMRMERIEGGNFELAKQTIKFKILNTQQRQQQQRNSELISHYTPHSSYCMYVLESIVL